MTHITTSSPVASKTALRPSSGPAMVASLAVIVALASGQPAAAESALPVALGELTCVSTVSARLLGQAKAFAAFSRYGFADRSHCLLGAMMTRGQSLTMRLPLTVGQDCLWFAASDEHATDVDLKVTDPAGQVVAEDNDEDATPMVNFRAQRNGPYSVTVTLCEATGTSFCALVLLEAKGWSIPFDNLGAALDSFVRFAGGTAILVDRMSEGQSRLRLQGGRAGWCLFGSVLTPHQSQSAQRLSPGEGTFAFLATGCDQATDIDLEVDDDRGEVVVQDIDPDPTPMGIAVTKANRTYNVTTSLLASRGAALTITGILRIEPAPNAASRRHMFSTLD